MLGSSALESGDKIFLTRIWKSWMYPDSKREHTGTIAYLFACVYSIDASSVLLSPDSIIPQKRHMVCSTK